MSDDLIKESIDFLRQHQPKNDIYAVSLSMGKDSIVVKHLCEVANIPHKSFFISTRSDPPEVLQFAIKYYPDTKWYYPKVSMLEAIKYYGPPTRDNPWCHKILKDNLRESITTIPYIHRLSGLRADESEARAKSNRIHLNKYPIITYKPIFYWPEETIWQYIKEYKLKIPILYHWGFRHFMCMICPDMFGEEKEIVTNRIRSMKYWPKYWSAFEHVVRKSFSNDDLFDEYWKNYLNNFRKPVTQSCIIK